MRKILVAAMIALTPLAAVAQTQPSPAPRPVEEAGSGVGLFATTAVVIGALIAADWLTKGVLSGPIRSVTGVSLPWVVEVAAPATAAVVAPVAVVTPAAAAPAAATGWIRPW